jgi:hypothetical protein
VGQKMADIMIRCSNRGLPVRTGLTADMVVFASLPDVLMELPCPLCEKRHRWRPDQAWIDQPAEHTEADRYPPASFPASSATRATSV